MPDAGPLADEDDVARDHRRGEEALGEVDAHPRGLAAPAAGREVERGDDADGVRVRRRVRAREQHRAGDGGRVVDAVRADVEGACRQAHRRAAAGGREREEVVAPVRAAEAARRSDDHLGSRPRPARRSCRLRPAEVGAPQRGAGRARRSRRRGRRAAGPSCRRASRSSSARRPCRRRPSASCSSARARRPAPSTADRTRPGRSPRARRRTAARRSRRRRRGRPRR